MAPSPDIDELGSPEFAGPSQGWPPKLKDVTNLKQLPFSGNPSNITEDLKAKIRQVASNDDRLKAELAGRFVYVSVCTSSLGKKPGPAPELKTRITFFNYANNTTVQAEMEGMKVVRINKRIRGYSPPHSGDEKKKAIDLARNDSRIKDKVAPLTAHVIRNAPGGGEFNGHRVMLVSFTNGEDEPTPLYTVLVDLTDEKVLSVKGPIVVRPERIRDESS